MHGNTGMSTSSVLISDMPEATSLSHHPLADTARFPAGDAGGLLSGWHAFRYIRMAAFLTVPGSECPWEKPQGSQDQERNLPREKEGEGLRRVADPGVGEGGGKGQAACGTTALAGATRVACNHARAWVIGVGLKLG